MILLKLRIILIAETVPQNGSSQCILVIGTYDTTSTSASVSIGAVIGSIFGVLILICLTVLVILILALFLYRKNRKPVYIAELELCNEVCILKHIHSFLLRYRNANLKYLLM